PLISFSLYDLPGELADPNDESLAFFTADIDLGTSFGNSMTFEIGDTDGDRQGAAVHNSEMDERYNGWPGFPDFDQDGDGLADWGWSLVFDQPGTIDVDNADGDNDPRTGVDGDVNALAIAGAMLGAPTPGHAQYNSSEENWEWISDGPTAGKTDDSFILIRPASDFSSVFDGPFYFGGLDCTPDEVGYVPAAMFRTVLYGPGDVVIDCLTDLNSDGEVDFFDVSFFLDHRVDFNGDTVFDFFDISHFLTEYAVGCP
ncbi:MAG: hypothetical protein JJ974_06555, partial [Phycisphaerales bacterium]|nr:hypothetical protein [Phycisphaerales bacterium]